MSLQIHFVGAMAFPRMGLFPLKLKSAKKKVTQRVTDHPLIRSHRYTKCNYFKSIHVHNITNGGKEKPTRETIVKCKLIVFFFAIKFICYEQFFDDSK
jgi:hypothetical protein